MDRVARTPAICGFPVVDAALGVTPRGRTVGSAVDRLDARDVAEAKFPTSTGRVMIRGAGKWMASAALALGMVFSVVGCSSSATTSRVVAQARTPKTNKVSIRIEKSTNDVRGESTALENGLIREFRSAGYEVGEAGIVIHVSLVGIERGTTIANVVVGMGVGSDDADVAVRVEDATGRVLLSFSVHASAVDKRYRQLDQVLAEEVPRKIRQELEKNRL